VSKRLVLIDGHAILHRAYHALPPLTNRSGELVNAVYGFCTILLKVIEDLKPEYLAVAFDTPKPTFRHQEYVGYQAQRPKMDTELASQIEGVHLVLKAFGVPIFEKPGYEADDLIGTLAEKSKKKKNLEVVIVSGDRDLFQLVDKRVKIYVPIHGLSEAQMFGEKEVAEKMGVKPCQIVDYKGLVGDASDNYPGVPGIGPKTAVALLKKYQTLAGVYRSADKIQSQAVKEKLKNNRESAFLSLKLARVITNVPIKFDWEKMPLANYKNPKAIEVLQTFGFKSLVNRLSGGRAKDRKKNDLGALERKKKETIQESLF